MDKNFKKHRPIPLTGIIVLCLALLSCQFQPSSGNTGNKGMPGNQPMKTRSGDLTAGAQINNPANNTVLLYPNGLTNAASSDQTQFLNGEYADWKQHYVTASGAGGYLRVQRDLATAYDTVSEGMGYGMLLAVYFDDQATFDRLYGYVRLHQCGNGLMHWMVSSNGVNISEFGLPIPHGAVYSNLSTGAIVTADKQPGVTKDPNYIQLCKYGRGLSDASDANQDIAAALILASARWRNGYVNYTLNAYSNITAILVNDIDSYNYIKAGALWGGHLGFNASYFNPAFMKLFARFINNNSVNFPDLVPGVAMISKLIANMYSQMDIIGLSGPLFPDWCLTSSGKVQTCSGTGLSDRLYYLRYNTNLPVEDGVDDRDGDGILTAKDAYDLLSFNYYYDAVRVPWRLSMDHSWYNDANAKPIVTRVGSFFIDKVTTLVDGYSIAGGVWNPLDRDGFNYSTGGLWHSATFVAMNATPVLTYGDQGYAQTFYQETVNNKESYANTNNYYGNTLRLMSLLYLSGNFINFYDGTAVKIVRNPSQYVTLGPLTIDLSYINYGVYGLQHCEFHDRAYLFNTDGTSWGNIGAGTLNSKAGDELDVGVGCYVFNINCGLSLLKMRDAHVYGTILAEYNVDALGNQYSCLNGDAYFLSNINYDVGCMDFSIGNITAGTSNINLEPGQSMAVLTPGSYGDITLKGRNNITFTNGIYYFNSYDAEPNVTNYMDTTGGPIIIFVKGDFNMRVLQKCSNTPITRAPTRKKFWWLPVLPIRYI